MNQNGYGSGYQTGSLPALPEAASEVGQLFEPLFWYITAVTAAGTLLVMALVTVFCVRYRRQNTTGSTPRILGSHRLELFWTVTPLMIFLTFFAWGVYIYDRAVQVPNDIPEIFVIGKQWMWKAQYPNGQRVIIGGNPRNMTPEERADIGALVLPLGRPVKVTFISEDVIHDFGVPAFRQKIDVIPGRYVSTWYNPTKLGDFHVFCDQYCGAWHSLMVGKIKVVPPAEFEQFLEGKGGVQGSDNPVDGSLAFKGWQHFQRLQCQGCHVTNEGQGTRRAPRAPNLEGLYGAEIPLEDGTTAAADEQYIRESIVNPRAKVHQGWKPVMPGNFGPGVNGQTTEEELRELVAYIKWLKPGQSVPPNDLFPPPYGAPRNTPPTPKPSPSAGGN